MPKGRALGTGELSLEKKILHLNEGGSWLRNCKEGHSTKSLSSCRWKPSQAERLGSVQPWFCQVSGCLKSFLGQRIYHGGRGNLGWAEEGRKCKECFLGLPGQVLPSRATEGALQGLRRAAGLLLLWSDYGCRESIEQPRSRPVLPEQCLCCLFSLHPSPGGVRH